MLHDFIYKHTKKAERDKAQFVIEIDNDKMYIGVITQHTVNPNWEKHSIAFIPLYSMTRSENGKTHMNAIYFEGKDLTKYVEETNPEMIVPWSRVVSISLFKSELFAKNLPENMQMVSKKIARPKSQSKP